MILSAVERVCKAVKHVEIYRCGDAQWIGTDEGLYLADGLPMLDEKAVLLMWSITGSRADKFRVTIKDGNPPFDIGAQDTNGPGDIPELPLVRCAVTVCGRVYFRTEDGSMMLPVAEKYLRAFSDDEEDITFTVRDDPRTGRYICAKHGWFPVAVIRPLEGMLPCMVDELGAIWNAEATAAPDDDGPQAEEAEDEEEADDVADVD